MKINKKFETQAGHDAAPSHPSTQGSSPRDLTGLYCSTPEDGEFFGCGAANEHDWRIKKQHAVVRELVAAGAIVELRHLRIADYHRWREAEGLPDGACVRLDYALRAPQLADPAARTACGLTPWAPPLSPANAALVAGLAEEDLALRKLQALNRGNPSPLKFKLLGVTNEAPDWLAGAILRADLRYFFLGCGMANQPLPLVFGSLWNARAAFKGSPLEAPAAELAVRYTLTTPPDEVEHLMAHVLPPNSMQQEIYQALMKHFGT
jgi:hypothetical protein